MHKKNTPSGRNPLGFPWENVFFSESNPHLVPNVAAVFGGGEPLADKAEAGIVGDAVLLTGQHQTFPSLFAAGGDGGFKEHSRITPPTVIGMGGHPEDHLPAAGGGMERSVVEHFVPEIGLIGKASVDHADQTAVQKQKPEAVGESGQPGGEGIVGRGLSRGKAGRLQGGYGLAVGRGRGSDQ